MVQKHIMTLSPLSGIMCVKILNLFIFNMCKVNIFLKNWGAQNILWNKKRMFPPTSLAPDTQEPSIDMSLLKAFAFPWWTGSWQIALIFDFEYRHLMKINWHIKARSHLNELSFLASALAGWQSVPQSFPIHHSIFTNFLVGINCRVEIFLIHGSLVKIKGEKKKKTILLMDLLREWVTLALLTFHLSHPDEPSDNKR